MQAPELARVINEAKDAVDQSCFGPLFVYPDTGNVTRKDINQVAWAVFTIVLQGSLSNIKESKTKEG